jgi:hypothetical protein
MLFARRENARGVLRYAWRRSGRCEKEEAVSESSLNRNGRAAAIAAGVALAAAVAALALLAPFGAEAAKKGKGKGVPKVPTRVLITSPADPRELGGGELSVSYAVVARNTPNPECATRRKVVATLNGQSLGVGETDPPATRAVPADLKAMLPPAWRKRGKAVTPSEGSVVRERSREPIAGQLTIEVKRKALRKKGKLVRICQPAKVTQTLVPEERGGPGDRGRPGRPTR